MFHFSERCCCAKDLYGPNCIRNELGKIFGFIRLPVELFLASLSPKSRVYYNVYVSAHIIGNLIESSLLFHVLKGKPRSRKTPESGQTGSS